MAEGPQDGESPELPLPGSPMPEVLSGMRLQRQDEEKKLDTRVLAVVSGKGGVGKTTFVANIGIALTNYGKRVLVIDCNVTTPHLSYYLGVKNYSITLNHLFEGKIDPVFAPQDQNGVMFIPASEKFFDLRQVDMKQLEKIVARLRDEGRFDFIILDAAAGLGREALGTVNAADEIIFVTTPTAPSIMDITRCDEVARLMGHKKFGMVLNMVRGKDHEIPVDKAEDLFNAPVLGRIPYDEGILDSTAEGVPITWMRPDSRSASAFKEIAAQLISNDFTEPFICPSEQQAAIEDEERWIEPIIAKAEMDKYKKNWKRSQGKASKAKGQKEMALVGDEIRDDEGQNVGDAIIGAGNGLVEAIRGVFSRKEEPKPVVSSGKGKHG
jgi:septum site-determining protein MinD